MKIGSLPEKKEVPFPRIKIECLHWGKVYETQYKALAKDLWDISTFTGPGVTGKVIYDLKKKGIAETKFDSGRSFKYTVEK